VSQQEALNRRRRVTEIQQPDYRNNGQFQFVTGYTGGGGAEMCVHLTCEEYEQRVRAKLGPGTLVEVDGKFCYDRLLTNDEATFQPGEKVIFCGLTGTVKANHGSGGIVDVDGEGRVHWHWTFQGEKVERV